MLQFEERHALWPRAGRAGCSSPAAVSRTGTAVGQADRTMNNLRAVLLSIGWSEQIIVTRHSRSAFDARHVHAYADGRTRHHRPGGSSGSWLDWRCPLAATLLPSRRPARLDTHHSRCNGGPSEREENAKGGERRPLASPGGAAIVRHGRSK